MGLIHLLRCASLIYFSQTWITHARTHARMHAGRNVTRLARLWNVQLFVFQQPRE